MHICTAVPMLLQPENRLLCLNATSPVKPIWTVTVGMKSTFSMLCTCFHYIRATFYANVSYVTLEIV